MTTVKSLFFTKIENWLTSALEFSPKIIFAIIVFALVFFMTRWLSKRTKIVIENITDRKALVSLGSNIIVVIGVLVGLFSILGILGLDKALTSLLAGAGIAGLAISLAFQGPILNLISGVIMSFQPHYSVGDLIKSNGFTGRILRIDLRTTTLKTVNGEVVVLPNKMIVQNPMINYDIKTKRRVDIDCGVHYNSNLEKVEDISIKAIRENINEHLEDEPVVVIYKEFGGSSIDLMVSFFIQNIEEISVLKVKSDAIVALKKAFDENDISIPFPTRTLNIPEGKQIKQLLSNAG